MRSSVSCNIGDSLMSGSNCFGRSGVESGQKREPTPPASTTFQQFMAPVVTVPPLPRGSLTTPAPPGSFRYARGPALAGAAD